MPLKIFFHASFVNLPAGIIAMVFILLCISQTLIFLTGFRFGDDLAISDVFLGAVLVMYAINSFAIGDVRQGTKVVPMYVVVAGLTVASIGLLSSGAISARFQDSVSLVTQFMVMIVFCLAATAIEFDLAKVRTLFLCTVLSSDITSSGAILQYFGVLAGAGDAGRMSGFCRHPNELGLSTSVGVALSYSLMLLDREYQGLRRFWLLSAALSAIGLTLSSSISAVISVVPALAIATSAVVRTQGGEAVASKIAKACCLLIVIAMVASPFIIGGDGQGGRTYLGVDVENENFILNRIKSADDVDAEYSTVAIRAAGFQDAWLSIESNPWIGTGTRAFSRVGDEIHNIFIKWWMEGGILALLGAIVVCLGVVLGIIRSLFGSNDEALLGPFSVGAAGAAITFLVNVQSSPAGGQRSIWAAVILLFIVLSTRDRITKGATAINSIASPGRQAAPGLL